MSEGESVQGLPRVELPADFIRMRDAARSRTSTNTNENSEAIKTIETTDYDSCPELEGSIVGSEAAGSEVTHGSSSDATDVTTQSDGLLVENEVLDQILDAAVHEVQMSLSSTRLGTEPVVLKPQSGSAVPERTKRDDELDGLRAAISNAVERGSCSVDKLGIVEAVSNRPPPAPESPPDAPRDPRDRRKRMRSGCFRYVCRSDMPNSLTSLITELKLTFEDTAIGLKLSEIYAALEGHPDKPLEDTWWGVSNSWTICEKGKN